MKISDFTQTEISDALARFNSKVARTPSGCLEWQFDERPSRRINRKRVPRPLIMLGVRRILVSHFAYMIRHGHFPDGLYACHSCDNLLCCEAEHIFPETQKENMADMYSKGRDNHRGLPGEKNPQCKVTRCVVTELRRRWVPFRVTARMLSLEYGLPLGLVRHVLDGSTWSKQEVED